MSDLRSPHHKLLSHIPIILEITLERFMFSVTFYLNQSRINRSGSLGVLLIFAREKSGCRILSVVYFK